MLDTLLAILLLALLFVFSLDFDRPYATSLHAAARHPFARFLAGLAVVVLGAQNPMLGFLSLLVVFFWISDVSLLSNVNIANFRAYL